VAAVAALQAPADGALLELLAGSSGGGGWADLLQ